jgi:D-aspartate ligase
MVTYDFKGEKGILPPVVILGGGANAISIARSLGRQGIKVYALNFPDAYIRFSRFSEWIPTVSDNGIEESWARFLLSSESDHLEGAVLLTGCDFGIEFIARNRDKLLKKFILDISKKEVQLCLLDKLCTYEKALEAGIPIPKFWRVGKLEQVLVYEKDYVYPLIVKPIYSHKFQKVFDGKFFLVNNFDELLKAYLRVNQFGIEVMLVEKILGPDDRLCSYYTYIDENGEALFDFTKRIIRRYPCNEGTACYHITDWNPGVRDLGLKYLTHVGLIGLANVEFKTDDRDGKLKLIECNARFTAANCLVAESGFDLALFVYNRLVGQTQPTLKGKSYKEGLRLWYPVEDFSSFKELRGRGELSFLEWLKSIMHPQVLPYFRWYDPIPTIVSDSKRIYRFIKKKISRFQLIQKTYWKNRFEAEVKEQRD